MRAPQLRLSGGSAATVTSPFLSYSSSSLCLPSLISSLISPSSSSSHHCCSRFSPFLPVPHHFSSSSSSSSPQRTQRIRAQLPETGGAGSDLIIKTRRWLIHHNCLHLQDSVSTPCCSKSLLFASSCEQELFMLMLTADTSVVSGVCVSVFLFY